MKNDTKYRKWHHKSNGMEAFNEQSLDYTQASNDADDDCTLYCVILHQIDRVNRIIIYNGSTTMAMENKRRYITNATK